MFQSNAEVRNLLQNQRKRAPGMDNGSCFSHISKKQYEKQKSKLKAKKMFLLRDICISRAVIKMNIFKENAWGQENCYKNVVKPPKFHLFLFLNFHQNTKIGIKTNFTRNKLGQFRYWSVTSNIKQLGIVFKPLNIT